MAWHVTCSSKHPMRATLLNVPLLLVACGASGDFAENETAVTYQGAPSFVPHNVHVPRIEWGSVTLPAGRCTEIYTTSCDGTAVDDTLLLLVSGRDVVAFDDNGGSDGCSKIRRFTSRSTSVQWEVWRKPASFDPTRPAAPGRVDVRIRDLGAYCPLVASGPTSGTIGGLQARSSGTTTSGTLSPPPRGDGSRLLRANVAVNGSAVMGFATHSGTRIVTRRPSSKSNTDFTTRMLLLSTRTGPVEDYDVGAGGCLGCAEVVAEQRSLTVPSNVASAILVGTRDSAPGTVDLRFESKRLAAAVSPSTEEGQSHVYGPFTLQGVSSFVVELGYRTAFPVGEPRGPATTLAGFVRYPSTDATHRMLVAHLDRCFDATCSSYARLDSTTRYRGHFGGVNVVSPIFLASHRGAGTYRVVVEDVHADVERAQPLNVWDRATAAHTTTLGTWNFFMDEDNLDCGARTAPVSEVWSQYRHDIDLMVLQEVEFQCHVELLNHLANLESDQAWEFFYSRGDTRTFNCDNNYQAVLANQRAWPDPSSTSLSGRGRGLEFGRASVAFGGDEMGCWSAGANSISCDSDSPRGGMDPLFAGHGLGCRMQPDYENFNEYSHALTHRIANVDGEEIIVVATHQNHIGSADESPTNGAPYAHVRTYEEDIGTLVQSVYGANDANTRIVFMGDLNMFEEAKEWEDMVRRLRGAFGYAIDTRLIESGTPISTEISGGSCFDAATGGKNDGVVLIGMGWSKLDPSVRDGVTTEEWSSPQGGRIEYRDGGDNVDCVAACSGGPETGCVNGGDRVLSTDHELLLTKIRTAF